MGRLIDPEFAKNLISDCEAIIRILKSGTEPSEWCEHIEWHYYSGVDKYGWFNRVWIISVEDRVNFCPICGKQRPSKEPK